MIEFTIIGEVPSKKNNYRINKNGGFYQGKQKEIDDLLLQLNVVRNKYTGLPLKSDCRLNLCVWGSNRKDLNNQIVTICDVLEKSGIIENDRSIKQIEAEKIIDNKDPRVIIELYEFN